MRKLTAIISEDVQKIFIAYFGRPADPSGLAFWEWDFVENASSLDTVKSAFGEGEEYLSSIGLTEPVMPSDKIEGLIHELYQRMFDRDAGEEGIKFYTDRLMSGESTIQSIPLDILNGASGEDVIALDNKEEVANLFTDYIELHDGPYSEEDIPLTTAMLQIVDSSDESLSYGRAAAVCVADEITHVHSLGGLFPGPHEADACFSELPEEYQPDPFQGYVPPHLQTDANLDLYL